MRNLWFGILWPLIGGIAAGLATAAILTFILWLFVISRRMLQFEDAFLRQMHLAMVGSAPKGK